MEKKVKSQRFRYGSFSTLLIIGALIVTILVNIGVNLLGDRVNLKLDATGQDIFTISSEIDELLDSLEKDVNIYVLNQETKFMSGSGDTLTAFTQANKVFRYFDNNSSHITLEYVSLIQDPNFPARFSEYELAENDILVQCGDRIAHIKAIDLFYTQVVASSALRVTASKAENTLAGAILTVTSDETPKVAMLIGRGEYNYTQYQELLEMNNYEVETLDITSGELTDAYKLAVIHGPDVDYTDEEIDKLDAFLTNGGAFGRSIIYFAHSDQPELPKLEAFLQEWGIEVQAGTANERNTNMWVDSQYQGYYAYGLFNDDSTYTENVNSRLMYGAIPYSRPLNQLFRREGERSTTMLMRTSSEGVVVDADGNMYSKGSSSSVDSAIPIMVLGTRTVEVGDSKAQSHVMVVGSVTYNNYSMLNSTNFANTTFMVDMLGVMTERDSQVSISPKDLAGNYLNVNAGQTRSMQWFFTIIIPVAILGFGTVVFLRRRHR